MALDLVVELALWVIQASWRSLWINKWIKSRWKDSYCVTAKKKISNLVPWVPETFLARFPVSVKSLYWPMWKVSGAERYCFDGADPIVSMVKSVGPDFGQDGWLAPNDRLRDFESNRRYNWLTRIDQHVKEYFQLCCWHDLSVLARSVAVVLCVGFGKFWKSMISNVLEGQVKSYEQTSGVFNFIQRN